MRISEPETVLEAAVVKVQNTLVRFLVARLWLREVQLAYGGDAGIHTVRLFKNTPSSRSEPSTRSACRATNPTFHNTAAKHAHIRAAVAAEALVVHNDLRADHPRHARNDRVAHVGPHIERVHAAKRRGVEVNEVVELGDDAL